MSFSMYISARDRGDELETLSGVHVPSELHAQVEYIVGDRIGRGAMAVAYYALRSAPEGECPVVLKVARPDFVRQFGQAAKLTVQKEAVALGRLNERVPSTPFVVRSMDTGALVLQEPRGELELPWIVLEYVHGGLEGTTLTQRVSKCVQDTDYAFDPPRAARAVECLTKGLAAVHEVGVVHRDLKPGNVLCCGVDNDEIFKVADFGVARPAGLTSTFLTEVVGTPGYVAPEAFGAQRSLIGPWTDVFSLASVIFFLLTGEKYLPGKSPADLALVLASKQRRSVLDSPTLNPEFRRRRAVCEGIDRALAEATLIHPQDRPQSAEAFATSLLPLMRFEPFSFRSAPTRLEVGLTSRVQSNRSAWNWIRRYRARDDCAIRQVAWDGDGRCIAATSLGLLFWSGTNWEPIPSSGLGDSDTYRFVHRAGPSRWFVGYDRASLASFTVDGMLDTVDFSDRLHLLEGFSGDLGDLAVLVERDARGQLAVHALSAWRWVRPIRLDGVATVASLARISDGRWLLTGRNEQGAGLVAAYSPLDFDLQVLPTPLVRAFMGCAGRETLDIGAACGAEGTVLWTDSGQVHTERIDDKYDISAIAVDPAGIGWAAGAGRLWRREPQEGGGGQWQCHWHDPDWQVPFISLFADVGRVIGVSADGAILEGRMNPSDQDTELIRR